MIVDDITQLVGDTPHIRIRVGEPSSARLYLKLEGLNPSGSVKDRACLGLIRGKLASGELGPNKTLLDASSGNMACAIALFGRQLGYPVEVVANSKLTEDKKAFLIYYGAGLEMVGDFTIEGNRYCRKKYEQQPERYCFLDQLHNWDNPRSYHASIGPEIQESFPELAAVVASLGSGGTLYGTASYLKQERPEIDAVAVQAAAGTKLPGTGAFDDGDYRTPFICDGFEKGLFDHVVKVGYEEAARMTLRLRDQGVFGGVQTGGVVHSALRAIRDRGIEGDVVAISGDAGWKNMEKLRAL